MATATQRAEQQGTRGAGAEGGRCTTRGIGALDGVCGASTPLGLLPQRQPHRRWPVNNQTGSQLNARGAILGDRCLMMMMCAMSDDDCALRDVGYLMWALARLRYCVLCAVCCM